MGRRYLKRISESHKEKNSESSSIQAEKNDPELDLLLALESQERIISFSKKPGTPTGTKAVKEETRWALDAAGNAGQYIKYFNMHLEKQNSQIKQMKKMKEKYDMEIKNLQSKVQSQESKIKKVNKELHDLQLHGNKKTR
jgi:predicted RNase H-like nuclease (RuvC/YqgF family)